MSTTYDVEVYREGRWWMVAIPALDGLTQARRLSEVEEMAADYIAVSTDVPLSTVTVRVTQLRVAETDVLPTERRIEVLRRQAADAEAEIARLSAPLARELAEHDVPVRDIGEVLGVSHQRAHQLVNA